MIERSLALAAYPSPAPQRLTQLCRLHTGMELLRDTPEIDLVYRYAEAWNRLDLDDFAAHLAADVSYTSQNVFDVLQGREAVEHYLRSKMQAIRQARGVMVRAEVGFCGSQRGSVVQVLDAAENRACVLLEQGALERVMNSAT